jgi:ParB-like chromosome segregation protein Spo0J
MAEVTTKEYVAKIADLIPSEKNPRSIGRKEYEALKKSLVEFPEMKQIRPVVIDEGMNVLAGHQRLYALQDLDYEDVLVLQVTGLTQKQKDEFMIKDNVSAGKWDADIIANNWDLDTLEQFGVPAFKLPGGGGDGSEKSYKNHEVTCPECGHHFELSESDN